MINGQTKLDPAKSMEKETFNDFLDWKQGCALRKIEGSPVLWSCEIQDAQYNCDFYEKTRIFLSPGGKSKVPRQGNQAINQKYFTSTLPYSRALLLNFTQFTFNNTTDTRKFQVNACYRPVSQLSEDSCISSVLW